LADFTRKFNRRNTNEGSITLTHNNSANVAVDCDRLSPRSFHVFGNERLDQLGMANLPIRQLKLGYCTGICGVCQPHGIHGDTVAQPS
jgi:hypothetical protein